MTCYAKREEDLPIARKIGDIIRIHRAAAKQKEGRLSILVNLGFSSAWCLFHSTDVNIPNALSTMELSEDECEEDGYQEN